MKLFDDPAEVLVNRVWLGKLRSVINLLSVEIHLYSARRTDHLCVLRHDSFLPKNRGCERSRMRPSLRSLVLDPDVLSTVPQDFRHPD